LETRTINVDLNSNSTIEVTGVRHTGENARLDYIELTAVNTEPSNNNNPVATGDDYNVVEDNILTVAANGGVLSNDSDTDGDDLTVTAYDHTSTAGGTVNVNVDGSLSYIPVTNFAGIDRFNYTVSDGNGGVDTATVTVEVTPENDAPEAVDDSYSLAKNTELTFDATSNDSDIDGDTLTIDDYDSASVGGGSVSLNGDGSLTYIPMADFTGNDSFTYSISDGQGGIDTATVNLTVTVNEVNTDPVRIEAENLTLDNYVEETGDFASGGKLITLGSNGNIGSASHTWTGLGGEYELTIAYFNESDGASNTTVKVDGVEVDSWTWNQPSSGTRPNAGNLETRTINVDLNSNSTIEVTGVRHTGENARLDFLELTPVFTEADVTPPTASLDATALTVSPGSNLNYNFTVTLTDEAGVDVSSLDSNDIQVTGPNGFSQTATLLSVVGNEATYQIQAPTEGWQEDNFGSYTVTLQADEVSDINGNFMTETLLGNFQVNVGETVSYAFSNQAIIARLDQDFVFTPEFEDTLEIMLLGDSITQGKVNNSEPEAEREGYRRFLWDALNDFGLDVDFVGSQSNGKGGFDQDHQGHPGWKIQDLANGKSTTPSSGIDNWISAEQAQPDLVLAMAGTNNAGSSGSTIANYLDDLIGKIFDNPIFNGELIVSTIAPIHPNSIYYNSRLPNVIAYNGLIPDVVESYANQGEDIHFVDIWSGDYAITEDDMTVPPADNGLHPSVNGYYNMAQTYYNAILDAVGVRESANNVSNIIGSDLDDVIVGNNNSNEIVGGIGADELTGNDGADVFIYETANEGEDILTDFNASEGDKIQISASGFGGGLEAGVSLSDSLAAATGVFVSGSNPQAVGDSANFLYDSDSGILSVDIDGEGVENAVTLATLTGAPALAFNDLMIA
jgi:lysophospholipase L1-like esterase